MPDIGLDIVVAFMMGIVAGLRAMTPPAAVSWAAVSGLLNLQDSWLAFFGLTWTPWILTTLAAGELITDQLPSTPSRTVPIQFATRLITGAVSGAAIGAAANSMIGGAIAGVIGAVFGTLGGRAFRARLAAAFSRDLPAALIEDLVAVGTATLLVVVLS
jgi:uncharacterized membrane protein